MARHPRGSHPKLTPELVAKLTAFIRGGAYIETAACLVGIDKQTFYRWIKEGANAKRGATKELCHAIEKAQMEAEMRDLMVIDQAAHGRKVTYERNPDGSVATDGDGKPIVLIGGMKPSWQAAAWRLERKFPKRWGRQEKIELSGKEGGPVQVLFNLPAECAARAKEGIEDESK